MQPTDAESSSVVVEHDIIVHIHVSVPVEDALNDGMALAEAVSFVRDEVAGTLEDFGGFMEAAQFEHTWYFDAETEAVRTNYETYCDEQFELESDDDATPSVSYSKAVES